MAERTQNMKVRFKLNAETLEIDCDPQLSLMEVLRRERIWSVKHGCETGECGACSVLMESKLTPTCVLLAGQAEGRCIVTVEGLAERHELHRPAGRLPVRV